jgi:hypothetical protein
LYCQWLITETGQISHMYLRGYTPSRTYMGDFIYKQVGVVLPDHARGSTLGLLIRLQRIGVPTCYLECVYIRVDNNMINISPPNTLDISVSFIILQR